MMKRYYQPKGGKKGKFALRDNTYRRIWYMIADYPYFKSLEGGYCVQVMGEAQERGNDEAGELQFANRKTKEELWFANRTAETAAMYDDGRQHDILAGHCNAAACNDNQIIRYIKAIEKAQQQIPEIYVDYVMSHIIERKKYKDMEGVSEKTVKIWVQRFIWHVAHNLGEA